MSIKQRDQKIAGAPEQVGPQWPTDEAKVRAITTNAHHYSEHMLRARAAHERALIKAQEVAELEARRDRAEQERQKEAADARYEHEQGIGFEVMLKAVGAPIPSLEQPAPTGPQGDPRQHAEQYGGPQTGVFALPGEPVCPCGAPMKVDATLGPIHPFPDGGYVLAGEVCRNLKQPSPGEVVAS